MSFTLSKVDFEVRNLCPPTFRAICCCENNQTEKELNKNEEKKKGERGKGNRKEEMN